MHIYNFSDYKSSDEKTSNNSHIRQPLQKSCPFCYGNNTKSAVENGKIVTKCLNSRCLKKITSSTLTVMDGDSKIEEIRKQTVPYVVPFLKKSQNERALAQQKEHIFKKQQEELIKQISEMDYMHMLLFGEKKTI